MRRKVSLLLGAGHPHAADYPIGRLQDETHFVMERSRQQSATDAVLLHAAAAAVISEKGAQHFKQTLERLESGD